MKSYKTLFFWAFVLLALSAGIYAYFGLKNSKKPPLNALSVLPDSCLVYISSTQFFELTTKINSQSLIADKLNVFSEVAVVLSNLQQLDSLASGNEFIKEEITDNRIHFALYKEAWLCAFNLKQLGDEELIRQQLSQYLNAKETQDAVFQFQVNREQILYFKLNRGVVFVSSSTTLIAKAIQPGGHFLEKNKSFMAFKNELSENNLLTVFINHAIYDKNTASKKLLLNAWSMKGSTAANIELQPSQVIVNGYIHPDSTELFYKLYDQGTQDSKDLAAHLPINTVGFKAYGLSSYALLSQRLEMTEALHDFWELVNKKALYNAKNDFSQNVGSQLIQFQLQSSEEELINVEIIDTLKSREHLLTMSDTLLIKDSVTIYSLSAGKKGVSLRIFEPLLSAETKYAALYDNRLLFSNSIDNLLNAYKALKQERNLNASKSFMSYMNENFTDEFNYLVYASPNRMKNETARYFNFKNETESDPFLNFSHFSFCASHSDGQIEFRMQVLHESENTNNEPNTLWTLQLDTNAAMEAQGFVNHISSENELLIQDEKLTLYLINAKGTILWKKSLNEKIQSPIYTVDIYKNGKFQLLFNTAGALHLIDRNGNDVENYPVKLPATASSALSLFDYDNTKDYRIFICCKNKTIYNYNIHGTQQEKFISVKTDEEVNLPVQYVQIGLSDYLVAMDKEGKIYTFSRKGLARIGLRNKSVANCKAFYCDLNNSINSSYIVYVDDKSALINKISFDDRKEIVKLDSETENAEVCFKLIDDNRNMDLLLTKNNTLWSYNFSGNLISETNAGIELTQSDFFKDESHSFYYSLAKDNKEVILQDILNQRRHSFKGDHLPFISNLFKDNKKYMILSHGAQLSCVPVP